MVLVVPERVFSTALPRTEHGGRVSATVENFISFALVAYLMVMFSIIGDLFRDRGISGLAKAVWIVALIFLPILTSLVYLIARGRGMAERADRSAEAMKQRQDAYIREAAGKTTPADRIAQALAMLDAGAISQSEYDSLKAKALA